MTFASWLFSAQRAWQNLSLRAVAVSTVVFALGISSWFVWQIIKLRHTANGLLVLHHNVYVGIDAIKPWWWAFGLPLVWLGCLSVDMLWAFGAYRKNAYQTWALLFVASAICVPYFLTLWQLIRINR